MEKGLEFECASCGQLNSGKFCSNCGEKRLLREDLTLKNYLGNIWNAITLTDRRFLRSLTYLLFKPGFLASEFYKGRRKKYASPISIFLFINLIYFIFQPIDALNSGLNAQINGQPYSSWSFQVAAEKASELGTNLPGIQEEYENMSASVSKLILFVLILFYALFLQLFNFNKERLFFFHLVNATHYVSFSILSLLIIFPLLGFGILELYRNFSSSEGVMIDINSPGFSLGFLLILTTYIFSSQRRIYKESILLTLGKSLMLFIGFAVCIILYRLLLFVITINLI